MSKQADLRDWMAVRLGRWLGGDDLVRSSLGKKSFSQQGRWVAEHFGICSADLARMKADDLRLKVDEIRNRVVHEPGEDGCGRHRLAP